MKLRERYRRLSLWNKVAFWGSICSIFGVAYLFLPDGGAKQTQSALRSVEDKQDETLAIVRRMESFQQGNDAALKAKFNLGYILFTATERREIVPLRSPMDEILKIDWETGYAVYFESNAVTLRLPNFIIRPPGSATVVHQGSTVTLPRRIEPWARPGIYNDGKIRVAFKVVATNAGALMIAMGVQSPPEPRPPLSELMR